MTAAKNFALWFLQNLPTFLMSEPIIYFVGLLILAVIVKIILSFRG